MTERQVVAGAVLAGGASRRMGRDKALVEVGGVPMAARVVSALRGVGADPVVLIGGDATTLAGLAADVVPDRWPGAGPLAGMATALTSDALSRADLIVVAATDQPWLDPETLGVLVDAAVADPSAIGVVADHGSGPFDGLPGVWRPALGPAVVAAVEQGERRFAHLRSLGRVAVVSFADPSRLADVDEPGDLPAPPA